MQNLRHWQGFTLIELMITVAIVGILSAIAYPSYQEYVLKSWRANASACLLEMANRMERRFTGQASYASAPSDNDDSDLLDSGCAAEGSMGERYNFVRVDNDDGSVFEINAVPQGVQVKDKCGTLTINQWGQKGIDPNPATSGETAGDCWRR
ncbi:type IV pilin protein [Thiorhodovibrio frisius]|uniref:Prepilin-type N-terminal cleavage/methylation domain-containing protein n=1 Tax=Thiorhodovibrio frisius TaxID=631362 RepID=H8YXH8_9GAMM|nr:type IV pilin protein [Thiorhodovibrio frisius]EIC23154.1 prepilin-type N-terminal cleavage/methylation domain-containing protein [Thiorhodovibrio frisius]WPL22575.1 Serogroup A1 [Thiorhodovibrio frisius]